MRKSLSLLAAFVLCLAFTAPLSAETVTFAGGACAGSGVSGCIGTASFLDTTGGTFTVTDAAITSATLNGLPLSPVSALLDLTTAGATSVTSLPPIFALATFSPGGSIDISGTAGAESNPLLSGTFSCGITGLTCPTLVISGTTGTFSGFLDLTSAVVFGQSVHVLFGSGVELPFGITFDIPTDTFNGSISGSSVAITAVPEPASLLMLGSGLLAAGFLLRRKLRAN